MRSQTSALRTIAILRGEQPDEAADLADRCWQIGMDLVEVPVQGAAGWAALESVARRAGDRPFGAGTVLTVADVHRALDLGASVVISPGIDREVVQATLDAGAVPLPGVMTPSEISVAVRLGLTTCKFFPANALAVPWLRAMRGPFPHMRFVAVGGVDPHNATSFLEQGAAGVAFGSSIHDVLAQPDAAALVAQLNDSASAWLTRPDRDEGPAVE